LQSTLTDEIVLRKLVTVNKVTEMINVGTFAYKINFKCENHLKKRDTEIDRRTILYVGSIGY